MRTIYYDFGPLTWATGSVYVHDADFDEPTDLADGEAVQLRAEDGALHQAVVVGVKSSRLGRTWTLRLLA